MRRAVTVTLALLLAAGLGSALATVARAQENRAGLVVATEDGTVTTRCIAFDTPTVTGLDLLLAAGLPVTQATSGMGAAVCAIDGTGCPADDCFCACRGGPECVYWSYWHQDDAGWQYAAGGAQSYAVAPGAVEGWTWGRGDVESALEPPLLTFDAVCPADGAAVSAPGTAADAPPWGSLISFGIVTAGLVAAIMLARRRG